MAFRLGRHIRSGTIDNTERGRITGSLKIEGIEPEVMLDLQGNAHPDMAGCLLKFRNSDAVPIDPETAEALRGEQKGHAGDISASQKRRILRARPDAPSGIAFDPSDLVMTNIVYLEWFDHYNGRIVVEGVGYEWEIDLPRWKLTAEEIAAQSNQARDAANLFMNLAVEHFEDLDDEIRSAEAKIDPESDDEHAWEKRLRNSEDRVDAILNLLDEATTDEERGALLDRALTSRTGGGEDGEESEEEAEDLPFDFEEFDSFDFREEPGRVNLNEELRKLAMEIRRVNDRLIEDPSELTGSDLLTLAIKVRTAIDLLLDDEIGCEPGFLIALFKREIARCQSIAAWLQSEAPAEESRWLDTVWEIRDRLIRLAGRLRGCQEK